MVALSPSPPGGRDLAQEAAFWKRLAIFVSVGAVLSFGWTLASPAQRSSASPTYFSERDTGYKNAGLVPMWAFHPKPTCVAAAASVAAFDARAHARRALRPCACCRPHDMQPASTQQSLFSTNPKAHGRIGQLAGALCALAAADCYALQLPSPLGPCERTVGSSSVPHHTPPKHVNH